ncbi:hypothetical protein B0F90DRAFT_1813010 [Multifurca ochricompacta]|uniref:Uncharacterized protein n=1 Tax=Multifurca ochricompacta TaxID=376703 RepID=A0AAD4QT70_9AGAM|nr:hypothetical protein B0F90DRAFT_1813010 [Multifurca ochricompacta]
MAAKVQWSDWMTALGNVEFDLFVDPGLVSVRFIKLGATSKLITVWSDEGAPKAKPVLPTLAQQLLFEDEDEEEELFAALADELREPTWTTPVFTGTEGSKLSRREHARQARVFVDTSKKEVTTTTVGRPQYSQVVLCSVRVWQVPNLAPPTELLSTATSNPNWRSTRA